MKIAIQDLIRSLASAASDKTRAVNLFKGFLKKRLKGLYMKKAFLDPDPMETVTFLKEMFDIRKDKRVVAKMLVEYDKRNTEAELPEFYDRMMNDVYQEVVRQMYEYFKSPEFNPEDQVEWTSVYDNILTDVIDNKAVEYLTGAAERTLADVPEDEFWSTVYDEIKDLTR